MVDIIPDANTNPEPVSVVKLQPSSQNATTAEAAAASNANKKDFNIDTKLSSVADLKNKAPEVWDKMLEGIAQNIIKDMRHRQERLKKLWREGSEG